MANLTSVDITAGIPTAGTGTVATINALQADGGLVTLGAKADAKSTATDTTAITAMSVLKQISASVQAPPSQAVTNAGTFAVQAAEADGANVTLGAKADAKSTATDTTSISMMSVFKQISASVQSLVTAIGITAFDLGSGTGGTRTLRTMLDTTQVASVLDCQTTVTRPADTNAYTANDAFANSTSAPTAGGFTFTNAAAVSGGGGIITDAVIVASGATLYQGEIWIFDSATAAVPNDNAAFACSDADCLLLLGKIPFTLVADVSTTSLAHVSGLNIGFHCVGTANLRFLVRITNAPTPANAETLTVRIKGIRS